MDRFEQKYVFKPKGVSSDHKGILRVFGVLCMLIVGLLIWIVLKPEFSAVICKIVVVLAAMLCVVIDTMHFGNKIVVCRKYLQVEGTKYNWKDIRSVRFAETSWEHEKEPVLLIELNKPVPEDEIVLYRDAKEKLFPMDPKNVLEVPLYDNYKQQYPQIMNAMTLYKPVKEPIEVQLLSEEEVEAIAPERFK